MAKTKKTNNDLHNITQKNKGWGATGTGGNTKDERGGSGRVSNYFSTSDICCFTVDCHEYHMTRKLSVHDDVYSRKAQYLRCYAL